MNIRNEILKALPIPNFFTWYTDNWGGSSWLMWAEEALEMEKEGIVKIERGRVELVAQRPSITTGCPANSTNVKNE